jgi:NADH-quinone oxidoreductase subunit J
MEGIVQQTIFWLLGCVIVTSAVGVIVMRNAVNSVLCLLVSMIGLAGFYILMGAPVVALFQIIIYVGAVLVLFLFVIMLLNLKEVKPLLSKTPALVVTGLVSLGLIVAIGWLFWHSATRTGLPAGPGTVTTSYTLHEIALALFSRHLLIFELTSLLLLVAAIGAILMTTKIEKE